MYKIHKISFYFYSLSGPILLLATIGILFYVFGPFLYQPIWVIGVFLSIFFTCAILFLSFQELLIREKGLKNQSIKKEDALNSLQSRLEETSIFHREEIEQMQQRIVVLEEKQIALLSEVEKKDIELKAHRQEAYAFKTSLEEALNALRAMQQECFYLQSQGYLKDLPMQYKQLRKQFEEKSLILDQTRRRLFTVEGYLLSLKKQQAMDMLSFEESEKNLLKYTQDLMEENIHLEEEVIALEECVNSHKKMKETKPRKELKQIENLVFDDINFSCKKI